MRDWVTLSIRSTSNVVLQSLATWYCSDATTGWVAFSYNLGSYAGQTVRVELEAYLDSTLNTNFFFDTFRLDGTVCQ